MRVIYMGTPDFAVPALRAIVDAGHDVTAVYTQPPRAAGRGMALRRSRVHEVADSAGIPVETAESLKGPKPQQRFASYRPEIAVVAAYGLLLPKAVLDTPRHGCLNLHASLLPRWRGAAPIHRAIMAGDIETGLMVMRMESGLDTGPVCLAERVAIGPDMTTGELHDTLAELGGRLALQALDLAERDALVCTPQQEDGATYARKIANDESRIDWSRPAREVHNQIRGLSPWPGAWFELENEGRGERIKALRSRIFEGAGPPGALLGNGLRIACGQGAVELTEVQRAGKRPMSGGEAFRGLNLRKGASAR